MTARRGAEPSREPISALLAWFALVRMVLRVFISEVEQARRALAPLLPDEDEQERRCETDTLTLPTRLDRDAGLLEGRLAGALGLVEAALRGAAPSQDEQEEDHGAVMERLAAEMADPTSPVGETLRRLREALEPRVEPAVPRRAKSERIQSRLAELPEWEQSSDGREISSRFVFEGPEQAADFLRLARDLIHEQELRGALMLAEDGAVVATVRASGAEGLTERDLRGAAMLDRLCGRKAP